MLIKVMWVLIMLKLWILLILNCSLKTLNPQTRNKINNLLTELKGFKFVATLVLEFEKNGKWWNNLQLKQFMAETFKAEAIMNENDIDYLLESINNTTISKIRNSLG